MRKPKTVGAPTMGLEDAEAVKKLLPAVEQSFIDDSRAYDLKWHYLHKNGDIGTIELQAPVPNHYICFGAFRDFARLGFVGIILDTPITYKFTHAAYTKEQQEFYLWAARLWYATLFNPDTCPWPGMAEATIPVYDNDGNLKEAIITNTNVPADLFINYLIAIRTPFYNHGSTHILQTWGLLVKNGIDPVEAWMMCAVLKITAQHKIDWVNPRFDDEEHVIYRHNAGGDYFLNWTDTDPMRFFKHEPYATAALVSKNGQGIPNNKIWHFHLEKDEKPLGYSKQTLLRGIYVITSDPHGELAMTKTVPVFGGTKIVSVTTSPFKIVRPLLQRIHDIAARSENPVQFNQLGEIV